MIVIVDDDENICNVLRETLESHYKVIIYTSALECLKRYKYEEADLYIIDIVMPGMSGVELVRKLLERYPLNPILVISGEYPINVKIDREPYQQVIFMTKPFADLNKIKTIINTILENDDK